MELIVITSLVIVCLFSAALGYTLVKIMHILEGIFIELRRQTLVSLLYNNDAHEVRLVKNGRIVAGMSRPPQAGKSTYPQITLEI